MLSVKCRSFTFRSLGSFKSISGGGAGLRPSEVPNPGLRRSEVPIRTSFFFPESILTLWIGIFLPNSGVRAVLRGSQLCCARGARLDMERRSVDSSARRSLPLGEISRSVGQRLPTALIPERCFFWAYRYRGCWGVTPAHFPLPFLGNGRRRGSCGCCAGECRSRRNRRRQRGRS